MICLRRQGWKKNPLTMLSNIEVTNPSYPPGITRDTRVEVKFRDGCVYGNHRASFWYWGIQSPEQNESYIRYYRIAK